MLSKDLWTCALPTVLLATATGDIWLLARVSTSHGWYTGKVSKHMYSEIICMLTYAAPNCPAYCTFRTPAKYLCIILHRKSALHKAACMCTFSSLRSAFFFLSSQSQHIEAVKRIDAYEEKLLVQIHNLSPENVIRGIREKFNQRLDDLQKSVKKTPLYWN